MRDFVEPFRDAIGAAGLEAPRHIQADGELHRFASSGGKRGDDAGWYVLHTDGIPAGAFGCWRRNFTQYWQGNIGRRPSISEESEYRAKIALMNAKRKEAQERRYADAAERAAMIWANAATQDVGNHPYLTRKNVGAFGLRVQGRSLVVPLSDFEGRLSSLQFIPPEGRKIFLPGGRVGGAFYCIRGSEGRLLLCEGFATGATLAEQTGNAVYCAMSAGNLLPVGLELRRRNPLATIIVCADNDHNTPGNPGLTAGRDTALKIAAKVIYPPFPAGNPGTDFNDLANLGRGSVR
jgi:putative DNA primase/helicase